MSCHPLVTQRRFMRSEFVRCLEGVSPKDALRRILPLNCLNWIVGHPASQEHVLWVQVAQGQTIAPGLREQVGFQGSTQICGASKQDLPKFATCAIKELSKNNFQHVDRVILSEAKNLSSIQSRFPSASLRTCFTPLRSVQPVLAGQARE